MGRKRAAARGISKEDANREGKGYVCVYVWRRDGEEVQYSYRGDIDPDSRTNRQLEGGNGYKEEN